MKRSRRSLRAAVVLAAVAASVVVPVAPGTAEVAPPATVSAEMDGVPERHEASAQSTTTESTPRVSEAVQTPIPFSMVGFELPAGVDHLDVRARVAGEWTDWEEAEAQELDEGPEPGSAEAAAMADITRRTEPLWMGEADAIQLRMSGGGAPTEVQVYLIDSLGLGEGFVAKVGRYLRARPTAAEASTTPFPLVTRAQWGADESIRKGKPSYASSVNFGVVHHTAGGNDYTRTQAPAVVRGIYHWHVNGNGWNDIGYNFLVDKFGAIYEGRYGGVDRAVIGAHSGGWNTSSTGVSLLGNYNTAKPTSAALAAFRDVLAWKFVMHGVDPSRSATTRANKQTIPTLVGHRNIRGSTYTANPSTTTDCPGQNFYVRMGDLRAMIESRADAYSPGTPVTGDWNGDGRETAGWFRDGSWILRDANSSGSADLRFRYGTAGDLAVVGDWNGDGRTTVGIVRDGQWHLRNTNNGGAADHTFWYGRGGIDHPMAGDWNGDGRDGPAIVRDGEWHLRNALTGGPGEIVFTYGRVLLGDLPLVGDWNLDGHDTPGIIRDGEWHLRNSLSGGPGEIVFTFGRVTRGDRPVTGDWNRDGRTGIGITRGGEWHLRNTLSGGAAEIQFTFSW